MNLLAFDTCFDSCSAAAGRRLRSLTPSISFVSEPMATGQAERLMPMIEEVMADTGMHFSELTHIAIAHGPGTFTGARIAVSAARALSLATGAAIISISSLQLMAMHYRVIAGDAPSIVIATDARRGDVYIQRFDAHSLSALSDPAVLPVIEAARTLGTASVVVAGSGAAAVAEAAQSLGIDARAILPDLVPDAVDMLFASLTFANLALPASATVAPLYLRPPDAKPPAPGPFSGHAA